MQSANVLYLVLSLGKLGTRRKLAKSKVEVDSDPDMVHTTIDILKSNAYEAINKFDSRCSNWVRDNSLPMPSLKKGIYAVPIALVELVEKRLAEFRVERLELIEQFIREYPARVEDARLKLRSNFNEDHYPSEEKIRSAFKFETRYISFGLPEELNGISKELFEQERDKAAKAWDDTVNGWRELMRVNMATLTDHLVDQLTPGDDGKRKKIFDSMLEKVNGFLLTVDAKNIAGDEQLRELAEKAREVVNGVTTPMLKNDEAARDRVRVGFEVIQSKLDEMVVDRPTRKIKID